MFTDKVEVKGNMNININNPYEELSTEELERLAALSDKDG